MGIIEDKIAQVSATIALENAQTRDAVQAAFAETQRGQRIDGARARALRAGVIYPGSRRLVGWAVRETVGSAAVAVDLYDGTDPGAVDDARLVASFTVPAGGTATAVAMPAGVAFTDGLFAVLTGAGVAHGSVWIGAAD